MSHALNALDNHIKTITKVSAAAGMLQLFKDTPNDLRPEGPPSGDELLEKWENTSCQRMLSLFFECFGVIGLCWIISEIAEDQRRKDVENDIGPKCKADKDDIGGRMCWKKLIDDWGTYSESRLLFYMSSLHPFHISVLIKGQLPYLKHYDAQFNTVVGPYLALQRTQGTYVVQPSGQSPATSPSVRSADRTGLGLTMHEFIRVVDSMKDYIRVDEPRHVPMAKRIDKALGSSNESIEYDTQRLYGSRQNKDEFRIHEEWLHMIDDLYLKDAREMLAEDPENDALHIPMRRCLAYAGLGASALVRGNQHTTNITRPLLGLYCATVQLLFKKVYIDTRGSILQVFRTVRIEDIGLDEIITSIPASASFEVGGLNMQQCGVSTGGNADEHKRQKGMNENALEIRRSGFQRLNIDKSVKKIDDLKEAVDIYQGRHTMAKDVPATIEDVHSRADGLRARLRAAIREHELVRKLLPV